jgi:hypothetical protein
MCLLIPFLMNKKKKSDRAEAAQSFETAYAPRPVADGNAKNPSAPGQEGMEQAKPKGVSSG